MHPITLHVVKSLPLHGMDLKQQLIFMATCSYVTCTICTMKQQIIAESQNFCLPFCDLDKKSYIW